MVPALSRGQDPPPLQNHPSPSGTDLHSDSGVLILWGQSPPAVPLQDLLSPQRQLGEQRGLSEGGAAWLVPPVALQAGCTGSYLPSAPLVPLQTLRAPWQRGALGKPGSSQTGKGVLS